MNGSEIVAAARSFLGTPWHTTGRVPGVGIDCAGLIILTFQTLGCPIRAVDSYGTAGDLFELLEAEVQRYCDEVPGPEIDGDILLFRSRLMFNHAGIFVAPSSMIHSYNSPAINKVVEHDLTGSWRARLYRTYRYRGVAA